MLEAGEAVRPATASDDITAKAYRTEGFYGTGMDGRSFRISSENG